VASGNQELHDLGALAGEGGPAGGGCGILLEGADALAGKLEIDLGELALGSGQHGIGIVAQEHALFAFDKRLTPHGEQSLVQVGVFVFFGHWAAGRAKNLSGNHKTISSVAKAGKKKNDLYWT